MPQVHSQAADEVSDVALPLPEIGVGHFVEHGAELMEDLLDGPLGIDSPRAHEVRGVGHEHRIVEHEHLRVEERRQVGPSPARHAFPDIDELLAGAGTAVLEARELVLHARGGDVVAKHAEALDENDRSARHDARRNPDARQALHTSSSNPRSTSVARAATASASSPPSAADRSSCAPRPGAGSP